ncbi:potassium-transporting ATPase subunit C [Kocuria rhizophila]|nr:potassium-transporting ATPase subunit C [Kocuria rhizophila]
MPPAPNSGPENENLVEAITQRKTAIAETSTGCPSPRSPRMPTASSSGLDPHISERYADIQIQRVARGTGSSGRTGAGARDAQHTKKPDLGYVVTARRTWPSSTCTGRDEALT